MFKIWWYFKLVLKYDICKSDSKSFSLRKGLKQTCGNETVVNRRKNSILNTKEFFTKKGLFKLQLSGEVTKTYGESYYSVINFTIIPNYIKTIEYRIKQYNV